MRNGLIGIGFSQAASDAIVLEQGYDSIDALSELTDATIVDLIATIRKPGGTIPNPAGANPPTIPNPGINVGHRAVTNLKLGAFVARHYKRTARPMDNPVQILAINHIRTFLGLKNAEDSYTEPSAVPVLERIERIRNHIENLDSHLLKTLGRARTPLAYVVRIEEIVAPSLQDPSTNYATIQEEMIARMPHTDLAYREDNIKVWEIIRDSLHESEAYNWIKRSERRRDGRSAYLALTTHYLGASKNETLRNQADTRLMQTFYGGEKNKFDWSKYVSVHKKCHNDLEATGPALSEDDKVRRLLNGINTTKLDTAVLFVRSSPHLMMDFDATVDSITTVVENIRDTFKRPFQQVASTETNPTAGRGRGGRGGYRGGRFGRGGRGRGGRGRGRGDQNLEPWTEPISSRWYQGHEIARMSDEQRQELRAKRSERDSSQQDPNRVGATGTVPQYPPPHPPPYHHYPQYPPSVVNLPPLPPMHISSAAQGNGQNPHLYGPKGLPPQGYPLSVVGSGSYGTPPSVYPGYPPAWG
jgi:hypothetical protein